MQYDRSVIGFISILICLLSAFVCAVPVAFPGAEGSGRYAVGGRGGEVYEVTNLANSGPGSIVDAVSAGNRTIVFRVSGTIQLGDVILRPQSNTTIAGQTAPGDGICLMGRIHIGSVSNVVIRYIRVRVDAGRANASGDAVDIDKGQNIIIDHVSGSYARDETISCQDGSNHVTVQWCIMSEALNFENHSYGSLIRGEYGEEKTYHHNLYAHNRNRNPRPGNYTSTSSDPEGLHFDFRNNVMYNWGGSQPGYNADTSTTSRYNFVGNVCIAGPQSNVTGWAFQESAPDAYAYWSQNAYGANCASVSVPADQWSLVRFSGFDSAEINAYKARSYLVPMEPVTTTSAAQALTDVLAGAGASFPARDAVDMRIVNDVVNGTGGFVDNTPDVSTALPEAIEAFWPTLNSLPAPLDTDHDGMPDTWETAHGLNLNNPADRNDYDLNLDYTNLEVYLNGLIAADIDAPAAPTGLSAAAGDAIVELNWDSNSESDLAGYNIYRSLTSSGDYTRLNTALLTVSNFTDNTADNGVTYSYVVTAVDTSSNESAYSDDVIAAPIDMTFYRDINNDGVIDLADLTVFLDVWLQPDCLAAAGWDINADCWVNYDEFGLLAANWLADRAASLVIIQENETGFCDCDGIIESEHAGYTGAGYANTDNANGNGIDYRVNILAPGTYLFTFRYAGTSDRPADLIVDGVTEVSGIEFDSTGDWTVWETTASVAVTLAAGIKNIRLEAITAEGLANIDDMQITGINLRPGDCP